MSNNAHEVNRKLSRCVNCGKRIFSIQSGRLQAAYWTHYGYSIRECDGLRLKYATPETRAD